MFETAPVPKDIIALEIEKINRIWCAHNMRAVGIKRATPPVEAAHDSVGITGGEEARTELKLLIEDYRTKQKQLDIETQSV